MCITWPISEDPRLLYLFSPTGCDGCSSVINGLQGSGRKLTCVLGAEGVYLLYYTELVLGYASFICPKGGPVAEIGNPKSVLSVSMNTEAFLSQPIIVTCYTLSKTEHVCKLLVSTSWRMIPAQLAAIAVSTFEGLP